MLYKELNYMVVIRSLFNNCNNFFNYYLYRMFHVQIKTNIKNEIEVFF